jgi:hypothetical protein
MALENLRARGNGFCDQCVVEGFTSNGIGVLMTRRPHRPHPLRDAFTVMSSYPFKPKGTFEIRHLHPEPIELMHGDGVEDIATGFGARVHLTFE